MCVWVLKRKHISSDICCHHIRLASEVMCYVFVQHAQLIVVWDSGMRVNSSGQLPLSFLSVGFFYTLYRYINFLKMYVTDRRRSCRPHNIYIFRTIITTTKSSVDFCND